MKKIIISLTAFMLCFSLTGCGNDNKTDLDKKQDSSSKSIIDIFKENNYKTIADGYYQKTEDNGNYYLFSIDERTITYNSDEEDYQIEYNWKDNTAWEYGCKYHYDDNTTTNDGEGMGECDKETINQLVEGKKKIDNELNRLGITIDDLKDK